MEQVNKIRKHINKKESKNKFLSFLSVIMAFLSIILGVMIYMKKDENGEFLSKNFGISVNFENFNSKTNDLINNLFKFEFENKNNEQLVSNEVKYIEIGNDLFSSEDNAVRMVDDGVIIGVYDNNESSTILVSYLNGVLASYSLVENVLVKQYDELKKGDVISSYSDSFKVLFKKNNQLVSYGEAFR